MQYTSQTFKFEDYLKKRVHKYIGNKTLVFDNLSIKNSFLIFHLNQIAYQLYSIDISK